MSLATELSDAAARETAVADFDHDLLVEAGAGSGKTSLLVERMLAALVLEGAELSRTAAITFTRKAAAEMQTRLAEELERLGRLASGQETASASTAAGRLWLRLAGGTAEHRSVAARARELLLHLDEAVLTTIHSFCSALLARHPLAAGLAPHFAGDDGAALEWLQREHGAEILGEALSATDASGLAILQGIPAERLLEGSLEAARQVPAPPPPSTTDRTSAVASLCAAGAAALRGRQLRDGWVSFDDILRLTRELLEKHPAIRDAERRRWQHLLVDELQDTDPNQYRILLLLSREPAGDPPRPRLFLVGDPKQSIYRFRGADLSAYEEFCRVVGRGGRKLTLTTNFRSRSRLLAPLNALFQPVLVAQPGVQPAYQPMAAAPAHEDPAQGEARVRVLSVEAVEGGADALREAEFGVLVDEIVARRAAGADWRDMLVLLPKLTGLPILHRAMQQAGVPFTVDGGKSFYKRQETADLAALLNAFAGAASGDHDEAAVLAYLRSPVGRVRDTELLHYRRAIGEEAVFGSAPPAGADCPAVRRALERLAAWAKDYALVPEDEIAQHLLRASGLRAAWGIRVHGAQAVANLDKAAELVGGQIRELGISFAQAADWLADRLDTGDEADQGVSEEGADAVGILSVHKAKGLERPIVFLTGFEGGAVQEPTGLRIRAMEGEGYAVQLGKDERDERFARWVEDDLAHLRAERARLLYVAMTRAREELVLVLGNGGRSREGNVWWQALAEGWGYQPGVAPPEVAGVSFEGRAPGSEARPARVRDPERLARAETALRRWESWKPVATPTHASPSEIGHDFPTRGSAADDGLGRAIGTAVHSVLERWDFRDFGGLHDALPVAAEEAALEFELAADSIAEGAARILAGLPDSDCGRHLAGLADRSRHAEVPILHEEGGRTWSGFIDLLYQDHGGSWVVADYKTDRGLHAADARELYAGQLRLYGRAVQQALGLAQPPRLELLLLDTGAVVEVPHS